MQRNTATLILALSSLVLLPLFGLAQLANTQSWKSIDSPIPSVLKFSGIVRDLDGKTKPGVCGMTFALYRDESGPKLCNNPCRRREGRGH
jgi:hypothetical protein